MTRYLGIDGGGSKTTFLLVDSDDRRLAHFETGASNYISVGIEKSRQAIAEGVAKLPFPADVVCGGFAGAGSPQGRQHYQTTLESLMPEARIVTETDAFIAYVGAVGIRPGLLLIAGTGAIALGRRPDGGMIRCGGWGPVFGDDGAGFWIGREAVRSALRNAETGQPAPLDRRVQEALELESADSVIRAWGDGTVGVPDIAALAPLVFAHYPDEPARTIIAAAASHLANLTREATNLLQADPQHVAAVGSVARHPLMQELMGMRFQAPLDPPELGAIAWARRA